MKTRSEHLLALAESHYEHHELVEAGERIWLIRRPDDSMFWAEIAVLRGRLVIVGDGPDMIIGPSTSSSPRATLGWFAAGGVGYLAPKVLAGKAKTWDHSLAVEELRTHVQELKDEARDGLAYSPEELIPWEEAIESASVLDIESPDHFIEALGGAGIDAPYEYGFGDAYGADLYNARAAVRRLVALLKEQQNTGRPESASRGNLPGKPGAPQRRPR